MTNDILNAHELGIRLVNNLEKVIFGKRSILKQVVICLFSQGHTLIEDVPGVGKTMLARSLAISTGCQFKRIQLTPDLLPGDITGVSYFDLKQSAFEFRPGPVFTQILLADEINRATPKTQSALLEAMGEGQVSVENTTYQLPKPFFVLATQNPIEYEGVFPLPESQMDRFLMRISVGYPTINIEEEILLQMQTNHPLNDLLPVSTQDEIIRAQNGVKYVHVSKSIRRYVVKIVDATRRHPDIILGASPRASLGLIRAAQATAILDNRDHVIPEDVLHMAEPVLAHRLILSPEARFGNLNQNEIIRELLRSTQSPILDDTE